MLTVATAALCALTGGQAYADASAWAAKMLAKRADLQRDVKVEASPWFTTGPLKTKGFTDSQFPENGVDLNAASGDKKLWHTKTYADGVVHDLQAGDQTATYFYRTLKADQAADLQLSLGSDDGMEFWFNGDKVISHNVPRSAAPDSEVITVHLKPGTNTVLFKVFNNSGSCGFYYNPGNSVGGSWASLSHQFPAETQQFAKRVKVEEWFKQPGNTAVEQKAITGLLARLKDATAEKEQFQKLAQANTPATDPQWLKLLLAVSQQAEVFESAQAEVKALDLESLTRAVKDLAATYSTTYAGGTEYLKAIEGFSQHLPALQQALAAGDGSALKELAQIKDVRRKALLANPLLDFKEILLVKRSEENLALPQNWQGNSSINPSTDNELAKMAVQDSDPKIQTVYKPAKKYFVGDVDLNWDADKVLFSSIGSHNRWQVFELNLDGTGLRQVTPADETDIDSYDPVYLPDGRIIYDSTSTFQGVPCVGGGDYVANLHLMNADGTNIRRLCFDQDNDWCPVVLPSGRVMYLRWEYTDSAHYFSRVLMSMNPDGTVQNEFYGSGSYWPNSLFYARPIPGSSTKFAGIVTGHHGVARMGELILFDATKGRQEDSGAVQRIPGYGKPVKGIIKDTLVDESWPKFLHPYPLSEKYFLVSAKPTPNSAWGIYLVDIYDNMLLLKEEKNYALLEPMPLRKNVRPPAIADKVKLNETNATVYIHDIYTGPGLRNVPRGTVKNLRLFQYEYSYRNQGGHYFVGMEGPWDVRRMIGTVPVDADGSAMFKIPANTPVALQPLDDEGKAMQQMRSWFVGMPGEVVSCVGCHEPQNSTTALKLGTAARRAPDEPAPWRGPKRGFAYTREVQPVLDKYCAGCHNGQPGRPNLADATITKTSGGISALPKSYIDLHPFIRRNGPEGDYHVLTPLEFHANTSLLVQMLRKGHHNVKLDAEAWDRLITWIDLNVPAYGTYHEIDPIPSNFEKRRYECKIKYALVKEDIEAIPACTSEKPAFVKPEAEAARPAAATLPGWPLGADKAKEMQAALGNSDLKADLGNGIAITFKRIPAGEFVMGDVNGDANEFPTVAAKIAKPFWMGATEISLEQYQQFNPNHRNGYYDKHYKDQVNPGYLMDSPKLPAIRVSWNEAMAFCQWLSAKTGKKVTLPSESQWEWACRAGTGSPMYYGGLDTDFSKFANLADASLSKLAVTGIDPQPMDNPDKFWDYVPKEARFNDGVLLLADIGRYQPNAWGLQDMIGNVAEWTREDYQPHPGQTATVTDKASKTVRGGSWNERPKESRASSRVDYPAWQRVYNVGFRVVIED